MQLHVRGATGFRAHIPTMEGQENAIVRLRQDGDVTLALLANAYDSGFATCWPTGSRLILDSFEEAWASSSGPVRDRLSSSFQRASARFIAAAPSQERDLDFLDEAPSAVLLALAVQGPVAHVIWVGGDLAVVSRGLQPADRSRPHTLRERFVDENPGATFNGELPNILLRYIGIKSPVQEAPEMQAFALVPGDTVAIVSNTAFRSPSVALSDVALATGAFPSPRTAASQILNLPSVRDDAPHAGLVVLRFDGVDFAAEVDKLIAGYRPDPRHVEWLHDWARRHRALPVTFDMGGVLALQNDGTVLSASWDQPTTPPRIVSSAANNLAAMLGAARTFPSLAFLAPKRPTDAKDCPHCPKLQPADAQGPGCPLCWYLGWVLTSRPPWFLHAAAPG